MWTRFRLWLAKKLCPRMRVRIHVGRSKVYWFDIRPDPLHVFRMEKMSGPKKPSRQESAMLDLITAAEGSEPYEMQKWREDPEFDATFQPREVPADLLKEALKETPLEGMDEKP